MKTCKDERELQRRISLNLSAIKKTVLEIEVSLEDEDADFALAQINDLLSQARGLHAMVKEAKDNRFSLCQETPNGTNNAASDSEARR